MFRFESVAAGYFLLLAIGAARAPVLPHRAARGAATAIAAAILVVAASQSLSGDVRLWLGLLYLVLGYWIPSMLTAFTGETRFERWLRRHDMGWRSYMRPPSPIAAVILELAYLGCYVVVPAAFVTVWTYAARDQVDRFWVAVLLAGFACYVTLPWLVSRPPRTFDDHRTPQRGVASFNTSVLRTVSHQFNTFPSGHVAVATAVALTVLPVSIGAGVLFGIIAVGIALGAAAGRYHYGIDVLAGALVGVAAAIVA